MLIKLLCVLALWLSLFVGPFSKAGDVNGHLMIITCTSYSTIANQEGCGQFSLACKLAQGTATYALARQACVRVSATQRRIATAGTGCRHGASSDQCPLVY